MVVLRSVFISFKQLKDRSDATDVIGIVQAIFNNRFTSKKMHHGIWPESLQMRPTYPSPASPSSKDGNVPSAVFH